MRSWGGHHVVAGHRGGIIAPWRRAAGLAGAAVTAALPLAVCAVAAPPAAAAGGYTVTATIDVGTGPDGVAVDPAARTAYVANFSGTVSVIDTAAGKVIATVPVGSDPLGVAVALSTHAAYVTNGNARTVSVISKGSC
jgi:serine/threonine-protein kinase